jgi:hypothetical protein
VLARQNTALISQLEMLKLKRSTEEQQFLSDWEKVNKQREDAIERVIKMEEDKVRAKLDAERKAKEEIEEKKRKAEEEKRKVEEEKKRKEEEEKRKREEEEAKKKREEEEQKALEEQARKDEEDRSKRRKEEEEQRNTLGMTAPEDDFAEARKNIDVSNAFSSIYDFSDRPAAAAENSVYGGCEGESRTESSLGQCKTPDNSPSRSAFKRPSHHYENRKPLFQMTTLILIHA